MSGFAFLLWAVVSVAFSGIVGVAAFTYVVRTWQVIRRGGRADPRDDRILDGIDHLQNQMYLVNQRLDRLERGLLPEPDSTASLPDGEAGSDE
jgi:hypothetical protein